MPNRSDKEVGYNVWVLHPDKEKMDFTGAYETLEEAKEAGQQFVRPATAIAIQSMSGGKGKVVLQWIVPGRSDWGIDPTNPLRDI